jgi:Fic family protein
MLGEAPGVFQAQQLLFDGWRRGALQVETLCAVHAALCRETAAQPGQLRDGNVVVRLQRQVRYRPPPASVAPAQTSAVLSWLTDALAPGAQVAFPVELAADVHWRLCSVHPFRDGNGRVARVMACWVMATCGYGAVRPSSLRGYLYARVADYYGALRENDSGDPAPWHRMFAQAVSACLPAAASARGNARPGRTGQVTSQ